MNISSEEHYLVDFAPHKRIFSQLKLEGKSILEIGVGHGELTSLILEQQPKKVVGFEIQKGICLINDERFTLIEQDICQADLSPYHGFALVANPPYSLIPFIQNKIDELKIEDVIMMVSPKYVHAFPEYCPSEILSGNCFTPPSRGLHIIITRGFNK